MQAYESRITILHINGDTEANQLSWLVKHVNGTSTQLADRYLQVIGGPTQSEHSAHFSLPRATGLDLGLKHKG